MKRLENKKAIVTGAGSGIGRAIVLRLAQEGARVVLADVDEDAAKQVADEIGEANGDKLVHKTDVTDAGSVEITSTYEDPEEARKNIQARQPHNRFVTPEEIAAMAAYLASDEAGSVVGACMTVDGGVTAR